MLRTSFHSSLLAIALLFSVTFSHLYGAWHGIAHFGHQVHGTVHSTQSSILEVDAASFPSIARELAAQWSALEATCEEHSESAHKHSCVSLDGLCACLTPVSTGLIGSAPPPSTFFRASTPLPLRGHLAWVHASARAPPGISIV
jgi:hypothetical protein